MYSPKAAGNRDNNTVDECLEEAACPVHKRDRGGGLDVKLQQRHIRQQPGDDGAANHTNHIGIDRKQWNREDQREHTRQYKKLGRRNAKRAERGNLVVDIHGSQLRGKGSTRSPRHDNGRHHSAHLPHHGDGHEIGNEDVGAKLLQLNQSHECENHADEEADQRHNWQCLRPTVLQDQQYIGAAEAGASL